MKGDLILSERNVNTLFDRLNAIVDEASFIGMTLIKDAAIMCMQVLAEAEFKKQQQDEVNIASKILGCMLIDTQCAKSGTEKLAGFDFDTKEDGLIFNTIKEMVENGKAVDLVTVAESLESRGILETVGGIEYLTKIITTACNIHDAEKYIDQIVKERTQ